MAELKSYTCSKCAGILMFDSDQEFFDCPFCGNRFDQIDFHAEEIMAQAEISLKEEAYSSAREKFASVLEKNPSDFEALKGLFLCEVKASSLDCLESPAVFDTVNVVSLKNLIARLMRHASVKDAEFFNQLLVLIDLSHKLKMFQNSIDALYSDDTRAKVNKSFKEIKARKTDAKRTDKMIGPAIIIVGIVLSALGSNTKYGGYIFLFVLFGTLAGLIIWAIYREFNVPKQIYENNPIHDAWEMKEYLEARYNHNVEKYDAEFAKLLEMDRAAKNRKPDAAVPEDSKEEKETVDTDHSETVICSKCAGHLYLDKARRVYECRSCGVAYGISLFFGMPMEKALNSMNSGRYVEAQKRFENILMVDPSNFDALLGRILCVGDWTRISDIDTLDIIGEEDYERACALFGDTKMRSSESDWEFFSKLAKLIFTLRKICLNNAELDELNRQVEMLDSIGRVYYMAEQIATDADGVSIKRNKTISDIENLDKETKSLSHEFLALKRNLIQMNRDSVLIR